MKTKKQCYEILGIPIDSSDEEVKSAYRELAKKNHPDLNQNPNAQEKFVEIQEAYKTILNKKFSPEMNVLNNGNGVFSGFGDFGFGSFTSFSDFVEPQRNFDKNLAMMISFLEACLGTAKEIVFQHQVQCPECQRFLNNNGKLNLIHCKDCGGAGVFKRVMGPISVTQPCGTCRGRGSIIGCATCGGNGSVAMSKKVSFKIEPGIEEGVFIKLKGQGDFNYKTNMYGDIFIKIVVMSHGEMTRNKLDIFSKLKVSYLDCILGADVEFISIHGKDNVSIPPLSKHGSIVKKSGVGINHIGDHFLTIEVELPEKITPVQKKLLNKIRTNEAKK